MDGTGFEPVEAIMVTANFPISTTPRILLADDQQDVLEALRLLLKGEGFQTETVTSPAAVLTALSNARDCEFDLWLPPQSKQTVYRADLQSISTQI